MKTLAIALTSMYIGAAGGCASRAAVDPASAPIRKEAAGTYRIQLCEGPCRAGQDSALLSGYLVLDTIAISAKAVGGLPDWADDVVWPLDGPAPKLAPTDACFALQAEQPDGESLASLLQPLRTRWVVKRSGDSIQVSMYSSVDRFYTAELTIRGATLSGTGSFSEIPAHWIEGEKIGPPEPRHCRVSRRSSPPSNR